MVITLKVIKISLETDVQPETIMQKLLTLDYPPRVVGDSYGSLVLKLAFLLFAFTLFRLMTLEQAPSLLLIVQALLVCFLISFVMLQLLSLLRKAYGTRGILAMSCALLLLALLVIII